MDLFKNFAKSTLASGITSGATSLDVAAGHGARFPGELSDSASRLVGTGADDAAVGTVAWSNPGNITADDGSAANGDLAAGSTTTHYLKATMAGNVFAVPADAIIDGITLEIDRADQGETDGVTDTTVKLVKGGVVSGDNKASGTPWPASFAIQTYGGPADMWGLALTPADVNASDFGAVVSASVGGAGMAMGSVDFMRITVHYSLVGFNVVVWNKSDFPDPADDPNVEILRVTAKADDTFTVARAQEGTAAVAHNTGGKTYGIIAPITAKTLDEIRALT